MASSLSIVNRFIDTLNKIPSFISMIQASLGLYSVNSVRCGQKDGKQPCLLRSLSLLNVDTIFSIVCTEFSQHDCEHSSLIFCLQTLFLRCSILFVQCGQRAALSLVNRWCSNLVQDWTTVVQPCPQYDSLAADLVFLEMNMHKYYTEDHHTCLQ